MNTLRVKKEMLQRKAQLFPLIQKGLPCKACLCCMHDNFHVKHCKCPIMNTRLQLNVTKSGATLRNRLPQAETWQNQFASSPTQKVQADRQRFVNFEAHQRCCLTRSQQIMPNLTSNCVQSQAFSGFHWLIWQLQPSRKGNSRVFAS